jgi:predicted sulfurtransferase
MMNAGFENVKQLKGGILGYFEETDGSYWKEIVSYLTKE